MSRLALVLSLLATPVLAAPGGPLPDEAMALPAQPMLAGIDVKGFFSSAFYQNLQAGKLPAVAGLPPADVAKSAREMQENMKKGMDEMEAETGLRPDRDIDSVVVSVGGLGEKEPQIVAMVLGRFDRARLEAALRANAEKKGGSVQARTVAGTPVLTLRKAGASEPAENEPAFAFPTPTTLVLGTPTLVEQFLASPRGRRPLESNAGLIGQVRALEPGTGYWLAFDQSAVEKMSKDAGPSVPPLRGLSLAGTFDGGLVVRALAPDAAAATNLADMVKGLIAMGRMQASQQKGAEAVPLAGLLDAISVTQDGPAVRMALTGNVASTGILAAIAIPSLLRARISANEAAAIGDARTMVSAEMAYQGASGGTFGEPRCLAAPKSCLPRYTGPEFVDAELAALGEKSGYRRAFVPGPARKGGLSAFAYTLTPLEGGKTGVRSFCADSSGRVCADAQGAEVVPVKGACPVSCATLD